ncbi:VOC family protein [Fictibacillus sp. b24]|uniref:VOC family protein n=1 Tax=unclassified Fictibacillus TaxID=2644029 RepID=UPI0025A29B0F|nr:VOC family protein [Fictibacillus sp. b24]MDM5316197.1 VOC family protein [Fictibacillus sp. b24]
MKLVFHSQPVKDMKKAVIFYRDVLGMEEAWREGDHTVAFKTNADTQILLEDDNGEHVYGPGSVFLVDSVDKYFNENNQTLSFVKEPCDIPPGRYAIFSDDSGNPIRIIDMSKRS